MRARIARLGLLGAVVGALVIALVATPAAADPTYPSQRQVDAAKAKVASTAATVGRLEAQLVAADARLEELGVQAAQAVEAYDGARWALQEATADAEEAAARFGAAQGQVRDAEDALGAYAAAVYRSGGDLAAVGSLLDAAGPAQLAHRMSMLARLGEAQQQVVEDLQVSRAAAAGLSAQAEAARTRQQQAVERVAAAKAAAQERVAEQKRSVAAIQAQRVELVAALAKARRTSVALEQARAEGIAKERAE
ncbi:MAG TPA: hypothetical protein VLC50_03480, partial [Actinomycetes bacterium]|nr:hypothetical protein [Actinomycetes bacterium]